MSKQTIALAYPKPADVIKEAEYQALHDALSESARGRSFLAEHAKRSRSTETNLLLSAIQRIEAQVRPRAPELPALQDDLRRVLEDMATARARIETGGTVPKAEQLNALLDMLQRRLGKLIAPNTAAAVIPKTPTAPSAPEPAAASPTAMPRPLGPRWLEALPNPAVAGNDLAPPLKPAAVHNDVMPPRLPPAANLKSWRQPAVEIEAEIKAVIDAELEAKSRRPTAEAASEALAAVMALSDDERLALFT
ncbi:MAG TPA: hypothetical protein VE224_09010 [Pseudolabrys sp.]|nr:hypothetical protein [Pseudolabrys sp.]